MNYLAHIFLSGTPLSQQLGGFIADGVKGKKYKEYPPGIARGISTHRAIDHFIDTHPLVLNHVRQLRPVAGKYAPVLLDIFLDHILARNFKHYTGQSLTLFAWRFYAYTLLSYPRLPKRFQGFVWHFVASNRLVCYKTEAGIRDSLRIMQHYRGLDIDLDQSMSYLSHHRAELTTLFEQLLPALLTFSQTTSKHQQHD
ncbi:MAG: ACP phosphodiesterase [Bacteroidales bacterium]